MRLPFAAAHDTIRPAVPFDNRGPCDRSGSEGGAGARPGGRAGVSPRPRARAAAVGAGEPIPPVGVRVHAVTGLVQSASRLKQRPPQVLAGAVKDLAAMTARFVSGSESRS